jgi:cation diffusion facilitator CzcD-associated flavoprotein CzcO
MRRATVVVIGAGQAGLSAAFHLMRRGFTSALSQPDGERTFVVLDAETSAGGAWLHRWKSLTMRTVNGIFDLPNFPKPVRDEDLASRDVVPQYFAQFEDQFPLPIVRPVTVADVQRVNADPDGDLLVQSTGGSWLTRFVINATGTWNNPVLPRYHGAEAFHGRQLHTRNYISADEFVGQRVAVVGGGISALQQLEEISRHATTFWYTRREPVFLDVEFQPETIGRDIVARVSADVEAGIPTGSVVSYTGLAWTPYAIAARDRGALQRRPMFTAIEPTGVREADGTFTHVDTMLWATGFKPALAHLDRLKLRNDLGGIPMMDTQVRDEPRVHLIGYGPSQSTVGANRAGRAAASAIMTRFTQHSASAGGGEQTGPDAEVAVATEPSTKV